MAVGAHQHRHLPAPTPLANTQETIMGDFVFADDTAVAADIREIDNAFDTRIGERLMDAIASKLQA